MISEDIKRRKTSKFLYKVSLTSILTQQRLRIKGKTTNQSSLISMQKS